MKIFLKLLNCFYQILGMVLNHLAALYRRCRNYGLIPIMMSLKIDMTGSLRFKKLRIPFYWKWFCKLLSCTACCWCKIVLVSGHGSGIHDSISYCGLIVKYDPDYRHIFV